MTGTEWILIVAAIYLAVGVLTVWIASYDLIAESAVGWVLAALLWPIFWWKILTA